MNKYKLRKFKCIGCGKDVELRRPENKTSYCTLACYRSAVRPTRQTGKVKHCKNCNKEAYIPLYRIRAANFCSNKCANEYQSRNKTKFVCKICGNKFAISKSLADSRVHGVKYCSIKCRTSDKEWILKACIAGNVAQQNKKGLNKLELLGREILNNIGVEFEEQVLMFNKFLVDVLIPDKKTIIQWDGVYWHTKPKRVLLDKSQDAYLKKCGFRVLRITDTQIKQNKDKVYEIIKRAVQ